MKTDESRRYLLKAATALGLSMGLGVTEITQAASAVFLKIEGVDGESTDDKHKNWIEVTASVQGNKLILRNRQGQTRAAKQGRYRLSDGRIILVKNGKVVKQIKTRPKDKALKKLKKHFKMPSLK
jgi:type VI protein secretion system component Hcp